MYLRQDLGEKTVIDEATTEEQDDADEEDYKGIGKWIALAVLGGTAAVAVVGVSIVVVRAIINNEQRQGKREKMAVSAVFF